MEGKSARTYLASIMHPNGVDLERIDPCLQLLGMRHDGDFLEEGSASWEAGVPRWGRLRLRWSYSSYLHCLCIFIPCRVPACASKPCRLQVRVFSRKENVLRVRWDVAARCLFFIISHCCGSVSHNPLSPSDPSPALSTIVAARSVRAVSRYTFKTRKSLEASQSVRLNMARSCLGWHQQKPSPSLDQTTLGALLPDKEARGTKEGGNKGPRPRKRAIVRGSRKQRASAVPRKR